MWLQKWTERNIICLMTFLLGACWGMVGCDSNSLSDTEDAQIEMDGSDETTFEETGDWMREDPASRDEASHEDTDGVDTEHQSTTSGCGQAAPFTGTKDQSIVVANQVRSYQLMVPQNYDPARAYPMIFGFHGIHGLNCCFVYPSSGDQAIFVAPSSLEQTDGNHRYTVDDLDFVDMMIEEIGKEFCIDLNRIMATGFSGGGVFTTYLGCVRGDVFRAIAPVGMCVIDEYQWANCKGPIATWIHIGGLDNALATCVELRDLVQQQNGCDNSSTPYDSHCVQQKDCAAGYPLIYCESPNLDHVLPAWAGQAVWDFFSSLP